MRRLLSASCVFAAAVLALAAPAAAQVGSGGDVAMSYSLMYDNDLSTSLPGTNGLLPAGWLFSASARVKGPFSVVAEVGADYRSLTINGVDVTLGVQGYLGGVRYSPLLDTKVRPFAQALLGLGRASANTSVGGASGNAFAAQFGGGIDIGATKHVALRLQGDYRGLSGSGGYATEFRVATGVVYTF